MKWFHICKKFTEIKESGYQYCLECNRAILPPKEECNHKWVELNVISTSNRLYGNVFKITYILKCEKCGDMKNHEAL